MATRSSPPPCRAFAPALAALALSCGPQTHSRTPLVPECAAPTTANRFDSSRVAELAGDYSLTLVADSFPSPGARTTGRLRLRLNGDSQRVAARPLVGTLEMNLDTIFAPYSIDPSSRDSAAPGVYFGAGSLSIGVQPNITDGTSTNLTPLLVWPKGFQGRWSADYGIARILNPATGKPAHSGGTFCAARVR